MVTAIAGPVADLCMRLFHAAAREARARRAERQLQSLDPRMLRDVGIERGQIGRVVRRVPAPEPFAWPAPSLVPGGVWQRN
jgi:uncharacterized protein YjiS (DUF1127 family)